jgi:short-subunit dehydrogenase
MRVAVVTGGSSGIGAAIARALTQRAWRCVLVARGRDRLDALARELGAEAETCDVGDRTQVEDLARRVGERHEAVHLLVNNAGIPGGGGFLDVSLDRIEEVTHTNYLGSVWCLRAFLPLLERGAPSDVVTVASVAGTVAVGASGPYTAAKHAQLAFSRSIATELAPRNVRVHSILPGWVETDRFPDSTLRRKLPDFLVMQPEKVANAVVRALEHNRREVFVPESYRVAAALQGLAPATLGRLFALVGGPRRLRG